MLFRFHSYLNIFEEGDLRIEEDFFKQNPDKGVFHNRVVGMVCFEWEGRRVEGRERGEGGRGVEGRRGVEGWRGRREGITLCTYSVNIFIST